MVLTQLLIGLKNILVYNMIFSGKNKLNKVTGLRVMRQRQKKFVYQRKNYSNPFFSRKKNSFHLPELNFKLWFLAIFLLILLSFLAWLILFSGLFAIKTVKIEGAKSVSVQEIENLVWQQIGDGGKLSGNLLIFQCKELINSLNEKYNLDNLRVTKKFLHTLEISFQEKTMAATWRSEDKYYLIDSAGNIISQIDPLNVNRDYPLVETATGKIDDKKVNITPEITDFIQKIFTEFKNKSHNIEVDYYIADNDNYTVKMVIRSGPKIYFNSKSDLSKQAKKLDVILKEKLKEGLDKINYIDLRYGDKVYYN